MKEFAKFRASHTFIFHAFYVPYLCTLSTRVARLTYVPYLCTDIDIVIPDTYKIGMIHTLVNIYFRICSSWSMFHQQLIFLREIFRKNGYPENSIDRCFKLILNRIRILKEKVSRVEKKPLRLVLPLLGTISLQTRT